MTSVSLIWFHVILTLCVAPLKHMCDVLTHKALCLSSARIWSLGFNPNLAGSIKQMSACFKAGTEIGRIQAPQRRCLDLLVKEIFVHNSWNVEQGISHPEECVFTAERQKHIVLCRLPLTRLCRNREHTKICCDTENHLFPIVWH